MMPLTSGNSSGSTLPSKEQTQFRALMKLFEESKQFKKVLKIADKILKKHPQHAETLSMKALVLTKIPERRKEALELGKLGLSQNFGSHLCWSVLGLIHRGDKDYEQAAKCYRAASRKDPSNVQTLRELSSVEVQIRQLEPFRETRRQILKLKPGLKINWTSFALAQHLCGNLSGAVELLTEVEARFESQDKEDAYECGELSLYKASILEEAGDLRDCLTYVCCKEKNDNLKKDQGSDDQGHATEWKSLPDRIGTYEMLGRVSLKLGELEQAKDAYVNLIEKLPNNDAYPLCLMLAHSDFWDIIEPSPYLISPDAVAKVESSASSPFRLGSWIANSTDRPSWGWLEAPTVELRSDGIAVDTYRAGHSRRPLRARNIQKVLDGEGKERFLSPDQQQRVLKFFDDMRAKYPSSDQFKSLPLFFLEGDLFRERLDQLLKPKISKGVHSMFITLKTLQSPSKTPVITELLKGYVTNLQQRPPFFDKDDIGRREPESPVSWVFAAMLLAQQLDYVGGQFQNMTPLQLVEKAIQHTPTLPELYALKGKCCKHIGDHIKASEAFEEGREMDLADRHMNTKAVKQLLRVQNIESAQSTSQLFSRQSEGDSGTDMQCMWYELSVGESHLAQKEYGRAMKRFKVVMDHFSAILDDQTDFHIYCLRNCVLRRYISFLKMHDKLHAHQFYRKAAKHAVSVYLKMIDGEIKHKVEEERADVSVCGTSNLDAAEKKRAKNRLKAQARRAASQKVKTEADTAASSKKDADPSGTVFLSECDPLEEAAKISNIFHQHCSHDLDAVYLAYQVHVRRGLFGDPIDD
eukprot:GHVN01066887.1.p2 GENE.GHVN01066887.1~~GHVN01066887.1.p2  ORF type:complete len:808 (+),score=84.88 GHVN01066887.1:90-2513(+)